MAIDQLLYVYVLSEEDYPANAVIVREGSKGEWIYIVLEGKVKIKKNTPKGMVTIGAFKEGDIIGEIYFESSLISMFKYDYIVVSII